MKKNFIFAVYAIALAIVFVLSGAFLVGTANAPENYWLAAVKQSADGDYDNSYATLDLDRSYTVKDEDGNDKTENYKVNDIYVYVGKVYSSAESDKVKITFDFKTKSSSDTSYVERVTAEVTEFYGWQKVASDKNLNCSRVKILTSDVFELMEVAFVSETGALIKTTDLVAYSDTTKSHSPASHLFDEQGSFNPSSAYAYKLSKDEVAEMAAADGLFTGGEKVGKAPLSTILNAAAIAIMGRNPFAIRFFSMLAGYFSLIALYFLIKRLFASDTAALFGSLFALFAVALLSGAVTASGIIALPFIILAYYSAFGFYAERYKFSNTGATVKNLIACGLFIALAVSFGASNIIALAGVPAIWGLSIYKLNKEYKKNYEAAKGLEKETVYMRHYRNIATCALVMPTAFIIMPISALVVFYAVTHGQVSGTYGVFFGGMIKDIGASFKTEKSISALGLLIGYGSEQVGSAYKLINYLPCAFALVGFIFSTAAAILKKTERFGVVWRGIRNKYKLTAIMAAFTYLPLIIGINLSVVGAAAFTCAYAIFIMIGLTAAEKFFGKKTIFVAIVLLSLAFITFVGCLFGVFGAQIGDTAAKILYGWQR